MLEHDQVLVDVDVADVVRIRTRHELSRPRLPAGDQVLVDVVRGPGPGGRPADRVDIVTDPSDAEDDAGYDEEGLERLLDELKDYSLNDLRAAIQYRLADEKTSHGLTSKQSIDALMLLMMLGSVLHGHGEVTDQQGHGDWSELHARDYPEYGLPPHLEKTQEHQRP